MKSISQGGYLQLGRLSFQGLTSNLTVGSTLTGPGGQVWLMDGKGYMVASQDYKGNLKTTHYPLEVSFTMSSLLGGTELTH